MITGGGLFCTVPMYCIKSNTSFARRLFERQRSLMVVLSVTFMKRRQHAASVGMVLILYLRDIFVHGARLER